MRFQHDDLTVQCIMPKQSRHIIDCIDRLLAEYYGFTAEELDFIVNFDIKYRMGVAADGASLRAGNGRGLVKQVEWQRFLESLRRLRRAPGAPKGRVDERSDGSFEARAEAVETTLRLWERRATPAQPTVTTGTSSPRVIAIDWSGDAASARRKIWLAEAVDGVLVR